MRISFTKVLMTLLVVGVANFATAQTVAWSEDFGGGAIPTGWTSVDANNLVPAANQWQYSTAGPYFGGQPAFASPTAANGFAIFNSDAAGQLAAAGHDLRLTTTAINCSALTTVVASFSNQYAYFSASGSIAELGVSTNGTTFTYYPILASVPRNDLTIAETVEEVDITTVAAGQATVYLQFRWRGNYEYAWRIDDIKVQDGSTPLPPDDVALASGFYAIAPSYQMPKNQVDTVRFLSDVANIGSNVQTNVTLTATVVRASDGATVYNQSYNYGTLQPGDTIENYIFPMFFVPDTTINAYTGTYTLTSDAAADTDPSNNTVSFNFEVTDGLFGKVSTANTNIAPAADNSWTSGTHFFNFVGTEIDGLDTLARYANAVSFRVTNVSTPATNNVLGNSVDVFLEQGYDVNDDGLITQNERTVAAFGTHTFVAADQGNEIIVPLSNFSGVTPLYALEDNAHYLVTVKYSATGTEDMFIRMSTAQNYAAANFAAAQNGVARYDHLLDIGNSGDLNHITNFSGNPTPDIKLYTSTVFTTSTADVQLPANALELFPNPATTFTTASLDLETRVAQARITIFNLQGQVLEVRNLSNVQNEQVRFDVSNYTAGTYLMSISTDLGHTVKRFVVAK